MLHQEKQLSTPAQLKKQFSLSDQLQKNIHDYRQTVNNILKGTDPRLLMIIGPCSIHDTNAALEYAQHLKKLQQHVQDKVFIVMRAYIEKPRTTVGWKGFLYDPHLNEQCDLQQGLEKSRELYLKLTQMGMPLAGEILNPIAATYLDDLLTWGAIGARTSESQIHREISSSMNFPIGFKNGTDGSVQIALDAIESAQAQHDFFAIGKDGMPIQKISVGNPHPHLILRGANQKPNYDLASIEQIKTKLKDKTPALVIDCSHGNSGKDPLKQPMILKRIMQERVFTGVKGVMIESHLEDGAQKISENLKYGQSITDGCLGWEKTHQVFQELWM